MDNDFEIFSSCHKNKFNLIIHIVSGLLYISLIACYFEDNIKEILMFYALYTFFLTNDVFITCVIFVLLELFTYQINNYKLQKNKLLLLAVFFYFFPEVGHILFNEQTVLKDDVLNINGMIKNIFVLLPYSAKAYYLSIPSQLIS